MMAPPHRGRASDGRGRSTAREQAVLIGEQYLPAWAKLRHSVLTGEPAFDFRRAVSLSTWVAATA